MGRSKEPQIVEGRINDSDDEEIDEDEAFNSEDELMYGDLFTNKKSTKKKSSTTKLKVKGGKRKGKLKKNDSDDDSSDDDSDDSSHNDNSSDDDDDDESGSENDWAGSSDDSEEDDDGGQYMLDLLNNLDKQVAPPTATTTSKSASSSASKIEKRQSKGEGGRISLDNAASEAAARLPESEFQASALSAMGSGDGGYDNDNDNNNHNTAGKLTLDSLMGGIADTANFASVQKSMRVLSSGRTDDDDDDKEQGSSSSSSKQKKMETTSVPVSRVLSERASRKVHTQSTHVEVTKWSDAVHEQRDAETLDFRENKATTHRVTRDTLVDKFEATNDFERELQSALEMAGMEDERKMKKKERKRLIGKDGNDADEDDEDGEDGDGANRRLDDDLGSNRITMAEYKKRHGELAKLRSLMFNEEQKRHRINKIKSKKYRKIRKRQRDRLQNADEEAAQADGVEDRERVEREEMERMKERMTLAHKNTSKWARRVLRRGSKMDVEERRALSLQIAKGDELRRKVMGEEDGDSGSESDTEEGLLKKARDILMEDDTVGGDENGDGKKKKGLFQLEFMKRGMETQRTRAKEEARKLLEELESNEMAAMSTDSEHDDYDEEEEKQKSSKKLKKKALTEAETNKVLPEGKLVASSLQFGKADGFAIKVDGNIELGGKGIQKTDTTKEADEIEEGQGATKVKKKKRKKKKKNGANNDGGDVDPSPASKKTNTAVTPSSKVEEEEENPWIVSKSTKKSKKALSKTVNINEAASMLVDNEDKSSGKRKERNDVSKNVKSKENESSETKNDTDAPADTEKEVGVTELSQAELVRRAFAAPADLEAAEEEFQKEKERMKERDDPTRKKKEDAIVSGWGSWAGAGAPPPRKKPRKLPPKLQAPTSKKAENNAPKRKDDGISTVIINEKRLKKTSKFQLSEIPYPYRSREEYERAIAGNIGQEWNTIHGTKEMSRPAVMVRAGKIIQPITTKAKSKANKQRRAPAKF
mmetsp:Transcript_37379/g.78294  ORF Transcript_37379/g.78294 Transcript_37379/m.78294 type:complete len:989 (-) Transcript_37379:56-3022(-)